MNFSELNYYLVADGPVRVDDGSESEDGAGALDARVGRGGGYPPCRWTVSVRLTPAAATLRSTSPCPGAGRSSISRSSSTSGPPGLAIATALIVVGVDLPRHSHCRLSSAASGLHISPMRSTDGRKFAPPAASCVVPASSPLLLRQCVYIYSLRPI